jgi:hypothetical protein
MPEEYNISGFSSGELQMANWWVRNRIKLRKLGYGILIAVCSVLWGYSLWGLVDAYAISYPRESRITREIALNHQLLAGLESDLPQGIGSSDVSVFSSTDNRLDMEIAITNPNKQWWAEFNYRFDVSGEPTPMRSGYVLPASEHHLTEMGFKPEARGGRSAGFSVENIRWHRVDPNFVGSDYSAFAADRLRLQFVDIKYDANLTVGNKKIGQTSFEIVNEGAYGFWSVELFIRLMRAGNTLGIQKITVTDLKPGERRPMHVVWPDNPAGVTQTEIIPQVNLLDQNSYLKTQYFR